MSDTPRHNATPASLPRINWRSEDVAAGLIFLAIAGLFAITALRTLKIGTPGQMEPGFFPLMVAALLATLGLIIIVRGARSPVSAEMRKPIPWRAVFFVIAAPVVFALSVRTMGLVPALVFSIACAVLASSKMGLVRGVLIVIGMTIFCIAVFSYGIGLTNELFNPYFWGLR